MLKKIFFAASIFLIIFFLIGGISFYRGVYSASKDLKEKITIEIKEGETLSGLAKKLEEQGVIKSEFFFKLYTKLTKVNPNITTGIFQIEPPITVPKILDALKNSSTPERSVTIIPGWDLRDMEEYFGKQNITTSSEWYDLVGEPAKFTSVSSTLFEEFSLLKSKPHNVSLEGYLAPETYRIFKNEKIEDVVKRLLAQRQKEFTIQMLEDIKASNRTVHEVLTLASILEKEVKTPEDRKLVADLFLRRIKMGWGLQADSTIHYLSGREGDVFTKSKERQIDSLWNTYKYRDLPPGPISSPSISSIMAAIYPEKNGYYYFLTTPSGEVKYAKTLQEHNANVNKYLR